MYLDDGLQIGISQSHCNENLDIYLGICAEINLPTSAEKTVRATPIIVFLGMLIDGRKRLIGVPQDKVCKALNQLDGIHSSKKTKVLDLQRITGLLNFFTRAIVPGRSFTRRLYAHFANPKLMQHHHVRVTNEIRYDLGMWREFLRQDDKVLRPFIDFDGQDPLDMPFTSDAAKSAKLGYASCFRSDSSNVFYYCYSRWEPGFLEKWDPSVQFLELFGLSVGILLFSPFLRNTRSKIYCDNQAVVHMVNNGSSGCKHCMILIRLITLTAMQYNVKFVVKYIQSKQNSLSDSLSRLNFAEFKKLIPPGIRLVELNTPAQLLPASKFYRDI